MAVIYGDTSLLSHRACRGQLYWPPAQHKLSWINPSLNYSSSVRKTPHSDYEIGSEAEIGIVCTRGQLPLKPLLLSAADLFSSIFHPPLSFPSARIKGTLASLCSFYKHLQMVTEFSLPGLWSSRLFQLNGYETGPELSHGPTRLLQFFASF